ncbi:aminopeptidase P family protein [Bradyrhizobium barranii subsp. barranii]|uniref:Aminopeptidase P family protein n=1 Tax=Bradyrhizobium barranii subsp. barranii TaxID=2823807 RepID=A0A7Z0TQ27_9BRAD|nr:aminopeptidase P family protein [Bradyrhizobium barranii]UGX95909.1 aminopeptidase P family protein [Bradyrhizobium barranii subsp. barranii]
MFEAHFQTFEEPEAGVALTARLAALREELARRKLTGFVIPRADQQQNEYVPPSEERLAWLTGFTGSAGLAVVLTHEAVIFVDGRYTIQAAKQVDAKAWAVESLIDPPPESWVSTHLKAGDRLGFDPWLHTSSAAERLAAACAKAGAELVAVDSNPVDAIWQDRPQPPLAPVAVHSLQNAGVVEAEKIAQIKSEIAKLGVDALVLSDSHAVAWTFNIRGADVAHTPLPLSYALVPKDGRPTVFIDHRKLSNLTRDHLEQSADVREPDAMAPTLMALAKSGAAIALDNATAADALSRLIASAGGKPVRGSDPIALLKAVKNATEIKGTRTAHRRDAVALARFLAFVDREASSGKLTEIDAVEALETFRRDTGALKDVSFPTISGTGPNGAIVHYRVTRKSNRRIAPGDLLLIDSGAQYEDGTTDVTRTMAVGEPTSEMRDRFTRVLRGHIAIARAVFPDGTTGAQLDTLARQYLWAAGIDFEHGTGHGVGSYLSVHEGPARISKLGTTPLKRGMILSNEPGYYKTDSFGIRIENLELVVAADIEGAEKPMNAFETLTLAPIDRRLIDVAMLNKDELDWLNAYHARVRAEVRPALDEATKAWLDQATAELT